jgi:hypothetical protein
VSGFRKLALLLPLCTLASAVSQSPPASATEATYQAAANRAAAKFERLRQNAAREHPDPQPVVFTEGEINAYLASGQVKLPKGVRSLHLGSTPGLIQGKAEVDFDAITAGKRNNNPLLMLFTGVHEAEVSAQAAGRNGQGEVHIETVAIDGGTVPRIALEFFADRYLKPKYPNVGLDSRFPLPERIDTATAGQHTLTIGQK